ncbi:MAG TPA: hypothetical protein VMB73_12625 [Acetobacteraceae bacterium]|nr:hypothetical protein [Acetobacteraceae bacterium]
MGQSAPVLGQFKPARQALEQRNAKFFLQPADSMADGALRKIQLICSFGKALMPGGNNKDPQSIE